MQIIIPYKEILQMTFVYWSIIFAYWGIIFLIYEKKHRMILATYRIAPSMLPIKVIMDLTFDAFNGLIEEDMQKSFWEIYRRYNFCRKSIKIITKKPTNKRSMP